MSTSTNPLAAGVPALQPPSATQTMVAPDGTPGEVPIDRVQDAVSRGFKLGMPMTAPDGTTGTIPVDKAHDAITSGFKPLVTTKPTSDDTVWGGIKKAGSDIYSTAAGIAPTANTNAATSIPGKVLGTAEDVAQGIDNLTGITTVVDSVKNAGHIIDSYEKSRASGASITDSLHAANERAKQADAITPLILQRGAEWKANPTAETVRALGDAVAAAAAVYGVHSLATPAAVVPADAAAVAPEAEDVAATTAKNSKLNVNPYRGLSKIEPAVDKAVAKAGLPAGTPEVTPAQAAEQTRVASDAAEAVTQQNVDQTIQNLAQQHATTHQIPAPAAGTATRDLLQANGEALVDSAKADYKMLDKFTDGQFTNAQQELKTAQLERKLQAGKTGVDIDDLDANVIRAQAKVNNLFDTAVKNQMNPDLVNTARQRFAAGQATLDVANDVRMTNKIGGDAGERATNLNALENRWQKQYDKGRLQQAFGSDEAAKDALTQIHAAREAGDVFATLPPTESQALRDLIANHTETGKFGTTTDWGGVRDEFSKLPDRAARFSDIPKVEKFINDQKFYQNIRRFGLKAAGTIATGAGLGLGYSLAHSAGE